MNVESVSNPLAPLESFELTSEEHESPAIRPGETGTAPDRVSAAERSLLVGGKPASLARESRIGPDDERTRILETELTPWRWICALRIRGRAWGTGWLAGPRTIITAGHCVYDMQKLGGWAREIEIQPGRNGDDLPFGSLVSRSFSSVTPWVDSRSRDYDIGCIHLDTPIGDELGWFSVGALPAERLSDALVNVSGYPAGRGSGRNQYHHENRIVHVAQRLFYEVDTGGGQSGAAVFVREEGQPHPVVVGVHAYGEGATPSSIDESNSGPRITQAVLNRIASWVEHGRDA